MQTSAPLLTIQDLAITFDTEDGEVRAVENVCLKVYPGQTLGIVGESGCGKSVTCHAILGLTPANGRIARGEIIFDETNLCTLPEGTLETIRGHHIAIVFQDPLGALNPLHTVGRQIVEVLVLHRKMTRKAAQEEAVSLLRQVGIAEPDQRLRSYPHQLSGGMNQRVMIAMAMACRPRLLLADEPTTALDATIQAQILDLLHDLQRQTGMAMILVTHDLGVVAETASDVAVMYMGRIVEEGPVGEIFARPRHPYTRGLLSSLPKFDGTSPPVPIPGSVPSPLEHRAGCAFAPRCSAAIAMCSQEKPPTRINESGSKVACFNPAEPP